MCSLPRALSVREEPAGQDRDCLGVPHVVEIHRLPSEQPSRARHIDPTYILAAGESRQDIQVLYLTTEACYSFRLLGYGCTLGGST